MKLAKKILAILLAAAMLCGFAALGASAEEEQTPPAQEEIAAQQEISTQGTEPFVPLTDAEKAEIKKILQKAASFDQLQWGMDIYVWALNEKYPGISVLFYNWWMNSDKISEVGKQEEDAVRAILEKYGAGNAVDTFIGGVCVYSNYNGDLARLYRAGKLKTMVNEIFALKKSNAYKVFQFWLVWSMLFQANSFDLDWDFLDYTPVIVP